MGEVVLLVRTVRGSVRVYFDGSIELPENESLWRNRSWYSRPARVVKRTVYCRVHGGDPQLHH